MIVCRHVSKKLGGCTILADVSFAAEPRDAVCIVGAAGSGKTVLLSLLTRETEPTGGAIEIDGAPLALMPPAVLQLYRSRLGIIFQEPRLLPYLTVRENIAVPLELQGASKDLVRDRTDELLGRLSLKSKADVLARDLSVSECALTGIARACVASPLIVLADEPLQHLDSAQAEVAIALLREARENGATVIALTTNLSLADILGARALLLERGKIVESATSPREESPTPPSSAKGARKIRVTAIHT